MIDPIGRKKTVLYFAERAKLIATGYRRRILKATGREA
jgi:hypothetical protein